MGEKRLRVLPNGVRWCRNWDKNVCAIWWEKILETICSTFFVFNTCIFVNRLCLACIVVTKCVFVYLICICSTLCVFVALCVYCCFTLDAGLLARNQYPEGSATGHYDTGFSWFPCVYKRMIRGFPGFQVATTCLSCSPLDLKFLFTFFIFVYM